GPPAPLHLGPPVRSPPCRNRLEHPGSGARTGRQGGRGLLALALGLPANPGGPRQRPEAGPEGPHHRRPSDLAHPRRLDHTRRHHDITTWHSFGGELAATARIGTSLTLDRRSGGWSPKPWRGPERRRPRWAAHGAGH